MPNGDPRWFLTSVVRTRSGSVRATAVTAGGQRIVVTLPEHAADEGTIASVIREVLASGRLTPPPPQPPIP